MPLGILPTNDFAFKRTFGVEENKIALISLLNAILDPASPIIDVTLKNPYNLQDYEQDKLSILDVKAVDQSGSIYDVEMQVTAYESLVQRIVFYGCELYAGQMEKADAYSQLRPVFTICLIDGILWKDAAEVHHAFRFTDQKTGRILNKTLEIHTLELGRYTLWESELGKASLLDCWLYWFLHAHEYERDALLKLFPQQAIQKATQSIDRISQITEDKTMYDAREKANRDQQWAINSARETGEQAGEERGKIKGKIELIHTLESLLLMRASDESSLRGLTLEQLETMASALQENLRTRQSS